MIGTSLGFSAGLAAGGLLFGLAYFALLQRSICLFGAGRRFAPAALTLIRLAGAIAFFAVAVKLGALPLLLAFFGFLVARTVALRSARGTA